MDTSNSTQIIIEVRLQKSTLRLRHTPNDHYTVEQWEQGDGVWEQIYCSPEYYVAMHVLLDEVCKGATKPRRAKADSDGENETKKST